MFIDANVFIYAHLDPGPKGERAGAIIESIIRGKEAYTNALVIDEVMWIALKAGADVADIVQEIYAIRNLTILPVLSGLPREATKIMQEHRLKPRDAIHVATMREYAISAIVSDDPDFDRVPRIKRISF